MSEMEPGVTPDPEAIPADEIPSVDPPADDDPDKGAKAALVAEREARRVEREEKRQLKSELEALRQQLADKDKPADELAIEQARREARVEAQKAANERIARLEVKAALAGKVSNPALALRLIDTSVIEVDGDGEVDADAIESAIATLLADAPELAVKQARFQGGADQGAKGKASTPAQLTKSDLSNMTPEQIVAAYEAGQVSSLLKGS